MTQRQYRCDTCGRTVRTAIRRRRCTLVEVVPAGTFRKPMYRCAGKLVKIERPRYRITTNVRLTRARAALKRNLARLRRAATAVKKWERLVARLEKEAVATATSTFKPTTGRRAISLED